MIQHGEVVKEALRLLADRCPRLARQFYWAGTSSIAVEELGHRDSLDLDFHTKRALQDVRPALAEIQRAFPGQFVVLEGADEFGSSFRGILTLPSGATISVEALSNYEDVPPEELVQSTTAPVIQRVALTRYLADKIQCAAERSEARDLYDIDAVLQQHPELVPVARRLVAQQDVLLLAERLATWTDQAIESDLRPYPAISFDGARRGRDRLAGWLKGGTP